MNQTTHLRVFPFRLYGWETRLFYRYFDTDSGYGELPRWFQAWIRVREWLFERRILN